MKAHLVDSDTPLAEGRDHTALCGEVVKQVRFVYMFDTISKPELMEWLSSLNTCKKCLRSGILQRYLYGIVNDQEVRNDQAA